MPGDVEANGRARLRAAVGRSETFKAAALAGATLAANGIALLFTIVFAHILGASDYGSLGALLATFLILAVPGSALQVAAARETVLGRLGAGGELSATVRGWARLLLLFTLAVSVAAVILRAPLASLIGVDDKWAAAATVPTGCAWMLLSAERGVLQGLHAYRPVGLSLVIEAAGRLVLGLLLVAAGAGVTGAYLGTPLAMLAAALVLWLLLRARLGSPLRVPVHALARLRGLIRGAGIPTVALTLVAALQNVDVIVVKHQVSDADAGAYAAAAVAAKGIVWVAVGLGLYVLPETARRMRDRADARPTLFRALALVLVIAAPMVAVYATGGHWLLGSVFGSDLAGASGALPYLAIAMSLLACVYLGVQFLLALGRVRFIWVLATGAVMEPILLWRAGTNLTDIALTLLVLELALAAVLLTLSLRGGPASADAESLQERAAILDADLPHEAVYR